MPVVLPVINESLDKISYLQLGPNGSKFHKNFDFVKAHNLRTDRVVYKAEEADMQNSARLYKSKKHNVFCSVLMVCRYTDVYEVQFFLWDASAEEAKEMDLSPGIRDTLIEIQLDYTVEETRQWIKKNRILNHYKNTIGQLISGVPQEL